MTSKFKVILGILTTVCTIIGAISGIPLIMNSCSIPKATISLGKYTISNNKKIVLHYLIPSSKQQQKCILPFPIVVSNRTSQDIDNFFLHVQSNVKDIFLDDGAHATMKRLLEKDNSNKNIKLFSNHVGPETKVQYITNSGNRQRFLAGEEVSDFLQLNAVKDDMSRSDNPWDGFSIEIKTSSNKVNEQLYIFEVFFYYTDNVQLSALAITKNKENNSDEFIIKTSYDGKAINDDNKLFNVFIVSEEQDAITKL